MVHSNLHCHTLLYSPLLARLVYTIKKVINELPRECDSFIEHILLGIIEQQVWARE